MRFACLSMDQCAGNLMVVGGFDVRPTLAIHRLAAARRRPAQGSGHPGLCRSGRATRQRTSYSLLFLLTLNTQSPHFLPIGWRNPPPSARDVAGVDVLILVGFDVAHELTSQNVRPLFLALRARHERTLDALDPGSMSNHPCEANRKAAGIPERPSEVPWLTALVASCCHF